jgi:nucleoside-diphosphate kinase
MKEAPGSLRALYGTDGTQNACHGSDSTFSATREIDFWTNPSAVGGALPEAILPQAPPEPTEEELAERAAAAEEAALLGESVEVKEDPEVEMARKLAAVTHTIPESSPLSTQDTFAMIKPLVSESAYEEIMDIIAGHGFEVIAEMKVTLRLEQAQQFYKEHEGKSFYEALVAYMTSGPVVALHLRREHAIGAWRHLIGPTNLSVCKATRPDSIRAKFALDGTRNACHGSDSPLSASRELAFMFSIDNIPPSLLLNQQTLEEQSAAALSARAVTTRAVPPDFKAPKRYAGKVKSLPTINADDINAMSTFASTDLEPVMKELLQGMMITRPEDVTGYALQKLAEMHTRAGKQMPSNVILQPMSSPRLSASAEAVDGSAPLPAISSEGKEG